MFTKHLNKIFEEAELGRGSTCAKFAQVQKEGNRARAAAQSEMVLPISPVLCATGCRTALEPAIKWLYNR